MNKKSYNLTPQPYGKLKDQKEVGQDVKIVMFEQVNKELIERNRWFGQVMSGGSKRLVDKNVELEKENKALREFKKNWIELKAQLVDVVDCDDDDWDTSVADQILKEMNKLEVGG